MGNNISMVILAGGSGKRYIGITKVNIEIGGKSVISRIVDILSDLLIPRSGDNIEPFHSIYNTSMGNIFEEYLERDHDRAIRVFLRLLKVKFFILEALKVTESAFYNINSPSDIPLVEEIIGK